MGLRSWMTQMDTVGHLFLIPGGDKPSAAAGRQAFLKQQEAAVIIVKM